LGIEIRLKRLGEGFEAVSVTACPDNSLQQSPIQGEAVWPNSGPMDADLAAVVEAWPTLPEAIKAGILAMVRAACTPE
jgi:hypothetical protein